jgi:hypothetical protein
LAELAFTTVSHVPRRLTPRWVGISGLLFVSLVIIAIAIGTAPEADATDAEILEYYTDSGNQTKQMVAAIILTAAVIALLVFVSGLRRALLDVSVPAVFADVAFLGGSAAALVVLAGWAVGTAVPATFVFSDTFDPDTARVILTAGNIWLVSFAGAVGSLLVGSVSLASRRIDLLPTWLEWAGLVLAPLMLIALPLFGLAAIVLAVWVLAVSLTLLIRSKAS